MNFFHFDKQISISKKNTFVFKVTLVIILIGVLIGILLGLKIKVSTFSYFDDEHLLVKIFNVFVFNYWLIFIIWLLSKNQFLSLLGIIIIFLKCFNIGLTLLVNIKCNNFLNYYKYFIIDFVIFLPLLGLILYFILLNLFFKKVNKKDDLLIFFYTLWCIFYSIICGII